jgi:uncharacterized protein YjiS (DUF1127 family)
MSTTSFADRQASAGEKFLSLATVAAGYVAGLVRAARNRRSMAQLLQWDANMLRDIGLTPGDVRAAMAMPRTEDPSQQLGALAAERRRAEQAQARERLRQEYRFESISDQWKNRTRSGGAA